MDPGRPQGASPGCTCPPRGSKNFAVSDFPTFPRRKTQILKRGDVRFPILLRFLKENAKTLTGVCRGTQQIPSKTVKSEARRWCPRPLGLQFSHVSLRKMQKPQSVQAAEHCKTRVKVRSLVDFLACLSRSGGCTFAAGTPCRAH